MLCCAFLFYQYLVDQGSLLKTIMALQMKLLGGDDAKYTTCQDAGLSETSRVRLGFSHLRQYLLLAGSAIRSQ